MADANSKDENFWKSTEPPLNLEDAPLSVSAPPQEVKVRTLRSDLESMAKSGGAPPRFETVRMANLPYVAENAAGRTEEKESNAGTIIVSLVALALLGAIIYFSYQLFFRQEPGSVSPAQAPPAAPRAVEQPLIPPLAAQGFVHHSLLAKPADQLLTLTVQNNAATAPDLQTFNQKLINLLAGAKPTANFFEINVKNTDGKDLGLNETFSVADTGVLDRQFISAHFNTDATFFVYKDKNGFWPGVIASLKPAENWLFIKNDIFQLEKSPKINNFFLVSPVGKVGDFKDGIVSGQPVRTLTFAASGAMFVYGWFRGDLILSTSEDGLKQALSRL